MKNVKGEACRLQVKAVASSSSDGIAGWLGETLKVRVTAPAERGKANAAIEKTIAEAVGVAKANVRVVAGGASPRKIVEIVGLSESEVRHRLYATRSDA